MSLGLVLIIITINNIFNAYESRELAEGSGRYTSLQATLVAFILSLVASIIGLMVKGGRTNTRRGTPCSNICYFHDVRCYDLF